MSAGAGYLAGLAAVAALGAAVVGLASASIRAELAWGIGLGLVIQAPLGWLTVRNLGTERFQLIWVLGMLVRFGIVAIAGLILVPAFRWQMLPTLAGLVTTILILLLVEVLAVVRANSGIKGP